MDKTAAGTGGTSLPLHGLPVDEQARINMVKEFSDVIEACQGKVFFRTIDGDTLVADSMLSAIIGFKTLLDMADQVKLTFECELKEDEKRIQTFLNKYKINK